jgi:hypothetical protein
MYMKYNTRKSSLSIVPEDCKDDHAKVFLAFGALRMEGRDVVGGNDLDADVCNEEWMVKE